jgi:transposase-like protein
MAFKNSPWSGIPRVVLKELSNMGKIRRKFDVSFKIQVCQRIEAGIQSVAEICRDNQLQRAVVEGWMQRYTSGTLTPRATDHQRELERENEKLKAKVGELTMTIDLLKKVEDWKKQQKSGISPIITSSNLAQFQKPAGRPASPPLVTITGPRGTK